MDVKKFFSPFLAAAFVMFFAQCKGTKKSAAPVEQVTKKTGTVVEKTPEKEVNGEAIASGVIMDDDADKVVATVCDMKKECTETTITKDGPADILPIEDLSSISLKTCKGGEDGAPETCSEPTTLNKGQLVDKLKAQSAGSSLSATQAMAIGGAAAGVAAVGLVGAYWYFRYFKLAEWNAEALAKDGKTFVDGYRTSPVDGKDKPLKGHSLFTFDLDETLIDETYRPDAREWAGAEDAKVPDGWRKIEVKGADGNMKSLIVRKPKFKPGAMETLAELFNKGHDIGLVTFNHRIGVGEALQEELLVELKKANQEATLAEVQERFKISAPTVGKTSNPLMDFNATKSIFLDFLGGKATLMENLFKQFPVDRQKEYDLVFFADDKYRFIDQVRRASLGLPIVGLKLQGNKAAGGMSDVSHLAMIRGLMDQNEYARFVAEVRANPVAGSNRLILDTVAMEDLVLNKFAEVAKKQALGADFKGGEISDGKLRLKIREEFRADSKKVSELKYEGSASKFKAFAAGLLILGAVGVTGAAAGAAAGAVIDATD